jgi:hypothetical protein
LLQAIELNWIKIRASVEVIEVFGFWRWRTIEELICFVTASMFEIHRFGQWQSLSRMVIPARGNGIDQIMLKFRRALNNASS